MDFNTAATEYSQSTACE